MHARCQRNYWRKKISIYDLWWVHIVFVVCWWHFQMFNIKNFLLPSDPYIFFFFRFSFTFNIQVFLYKNSLIDQNNELFFIIRPFFSSPPHARMKYWSLTDTIFTWRFLIVLFLNAFLLHSCNDLFPYFKNSKKKRQKPFSALFNFKVAWSPPFWMFTKQVLFFLYPAI